jgi:hypothetical protein
MRPPPEGYPLVVDAVARIAATAPARGLNGLMRDLDSMFLPPRPLPEPAIRARAVVESIDWSRPVIVVWIPGTSGRDVPEHVAESLQRRGGHAAVAMPYEATWRLRESVPDGEATLRELLPLLAARRRRGQRIVLLGESQGAWIISSIMRDPALGRIVDRAGLVAHPAMAPAHAHEATSDEIVRLDARVREFNAHDDVVTRDVGDSADAVLEVVDSFARLEIGRALAKALGVAVTNPALVQALVASQLFRLRGEDNPHETDGLVDDAVDWVLDAPNPSS